MPRLAVLDRPCPVDAGLVAERPNEARSSYCLPKQVEHRGRRHERIILAVPEPAGTLIGAQEHEARGVFHIAAEAFPALTELPPRKPLTRISLAPQAVIGDKVADCFDHVPIRGDIVLDDL